MNVKPLFESDSYKPVDKKRPVPTHNREHPKDARFLHRTGKAIVGATDCKTYTRPSDGTAVVYGRKGENICTQRGAIAGLRDKMALAASTAKVTRFVNSQTHTDRQIDRPAPLLVGVHTPVRRVMKMKTVAPCRRPA